MLSPWLLAATFSQHMLDWYLNNISQTTVKAHSHTAIAIASVIVMTCGIAIAIANMGYKAIFEIVIAMSQVIAMWTVLRKCYEPII